MTIREQLRTEIDRLDERYLMVLYRIVCRFPHISGQEQARTQRESIVSLCQEIADAGGLGIQDPQAWQREVRQDRPLPLREA